MRKYKKVACFTSKTGAKKKAMAMRKRGMTAQVQKSGKKFCVKSAGKRKK